MLPYSGNSGISTNYTDDIINSKDGARILSRDGITNDALSKSRDNVLHAVSGESCDRLRPSCRFSDKSMSKSSRLFPESAPNKSGRRTETNMVKAKAKSSYKHIPHKDKPPHLVARRNARERRRVQAVNNSFARLRKHIPYQNRNKRLSKVKTLKIAIDYIHHLQDLIEEHDILVAKRQHVNVTMATQQYFSHENSVNWQNVPRYTQNGGLMYDQFGRPDISPCAPTFD